jgi:hypothetical protein
VLVVRRPEGLAAFLARKDDMVEHLYVRPEAQRAARLDAAALNCFLRERKLC